ncbi:hypothetical protein [Nocardia aurantia]|uniref:Mce protein n=1 Tax=Nocardia aurantia TaxID=2585199 RepID=A0A7K0DIL8_9NOCA|nr:hypothetical protein [Nocardia aurantia]MQY25527.1 hypothetical protein [Nocardia aurantia]
MEKTTPGTVLEADTDEATDATKSTTGQSVSESEAKAPETSAEESSAASGDEPAAASGAKASAAGAEKPSGTVADEPSAALAVAPAATADTSAGTAKAGPAGKTGAEPGRRRLLLRGGLAAGAVLLVVATVLAVVFAWKLHNRDRVDAAAREAAATAQSYVVTLTSIDSQHIDQNFTDVLGGATGDFKDMYAQSSTQLKTLLVQNKAVSKGRVVDASIKSASVDRVEVMLFVDQEVSNSASPDPRVDRSRILMTMQRVGGHWLAAKVEMV